MGLLNTQNERTEKQRNNETNRPEQRESVNEPLIALSHRKVRNQGKKKTIATK